MRILRSQFTRLISGLHFIACLARCLVKQRCIRKRTPSKVIRVPFTVELCARVESRFIRRSM
jgi:hypothetical protein